MRDAAVRTGRDRPHQSTTKATRTNIRSVLTPQRMFDFLWEADLQQGTREVVDFLAKNPQEFASAETREILSRFRCFCGHESSFLMSGVHLVRGQTYGDFLKKFTKGDFRHRVLDATEFLLENRPEAIVMRRTAEDYVRMYRVFYPKRHEPDLDVWDFIAFHTSCVVC